MNMGEGKGKGEGKEEGEGRRGREKEGKREGGINSYWHLNFPTLLTCSVTFTLISSNLS